MIAALDRDMKQLAVDQTFAQLQKKYEQGGEQALKTVLQRMTEGSEGEDGETTADQQNVPKAKKPGSNGMGVSSLLSLTIHIPPSDLRWGILC